jgi:hypothetical protein
MGKKRGLQNKEKLPLKLLMVSFAGYSKHSSLLHSYFETIIAINQTVEYQQPTREAMFLSIAKPLW